MTLDPSVEDSITKRNIEVKKSIWDKLIKVKAVEGRLLSKIIEIALTEYFEKHHPSLA